MFFWLSSAELAIARVANRVAAGGHHVPDETIRRRYVGGIRNFFTLYQPIAATWRVYNNSVLGHPWLIAWGSRLKVMKIKDEVAWSQMKKVAMKRTTKPNIEKIFAEGDAIDAAVNAAVRTAVEEHRLAGRPLSEWRDGQVVLVPPSKFPKTNGKNGTRSKRSR